MFVGCLVFVAWDRFRFVICFDRQNNKASIPWACIWRSMAAQFSMWHGNHGVFRSSTILGFTWTMQLYSITSGWCFPKIFLIFSPRKIWMTCAYFCKIGLGSTTTNKTSVFAAGASGSDPSDPFRCQALSYSMLLPFTTALFFTPLLGPYQETGSRHDTFNWCEFEWSRCFFWKFSAIYFGRGSWKRRFPYGPFHLLCVQVFSKEKGSTWTNHTPESYLRIIPRIIPPNHTPKPYHRITPHTILFF